MRRPLWHVSMQSFSTEVYSSWKIKTSGGIDYTVVRGISRIISAGVWGISISHLLCGKCETYLMVSAPDTELEDSLKPSFLSPGWYMSIRVPSLRRSCIRSDQDKIHTQNNTLITRLQSAVGSSPTQGSFSPLPNMLSCLGVVDVLFALHLLCSILLSSSKSTSSSS